MDAGKVETQARTTLLVLAGVAACLAALAAVVVWAELRDSPEYDPLHYTTPQTVTSRVDRLGGTPAVELGDTVNVTGETCADEETPVLVTISWKPVDPRASSIVVNSESGSIREEGCTIARFQIPAAVARAVRAQHADGHRTPLWQIQGVETPIGPDGEGIPEVWVTEPFVIAP